MSQEPAQQLPQGVVPGISDSERPARLGVWVQSLLFILLAASFVSGVLVWRGEAIQQARLESPVWLRPSLVAHGSLNPFLCGLFGYLVCQHFRWSWAARANWRTGLLMELVYLGLIVSGVGLYYWGGESGREWVSLGHRWLGLALPLGIGLHIWRGRTWVAARMRL